MKTIARKNGFTWDGSHWRNNDGGISLSDPPILPSRMILSNGETVDSVVLDFSEAGVEITPATHFNKSIVLWLSRHLPQNAQIKELNKFVNDFTILNFTERYSDDMLRWMCEAYQPSVVMAVLPIPELETVRRAFEGVLLVAKMDYATAPRHIKFIEIEELRVK